MQIISKSEAVLLGLKKYFTGKPCKQGHISEKYTNKSTCVECLRLSSALRIDKKRESDKKRYHSLTDAQREKERTRLRIHAAKKYKENPRKAIDCVLRSSRKHRDKKLKALAKWKEKNPNWNKEYRQLPHAKEKARFFASRRRAIKIQAMPLWANQDLIELIYATCPDGMHVDHIVPLVSKFVCGLHCEANLQHLPAKENFSKNNHWWPDMP